MGLAVPDLQTLMRPGLLQLAALPPLALYVHLPWCLQKCPYCDFNSHQVPAAGAPEQAYLEALEQDLVAALPLVWGRVVHSIFIGGGTPSLFGPAAIERLLGLVRAVLRLSPDCEITLEANPGSFERDRFRAFRAAGVTRLSIGVQSFHDPHLQALGRVHDAAQAHAAVAEASAAFDTFNIDLMYALPGQTLDQLEADLHQALAHQPMHLSLYQLTLEPNTRFAVQPPRDLPDGDLAAAMQDLLIEHAALAGLSRYEVSAFARPGHRCWHNWNYWTFGDYLGIGAGAHSKLSFAHRIVRQVRLRDPAAYMAGAARGEALAQSQEVARTDLPFEYAMNALRLTDGFAWVDFTARTGLPASVLRAGLARAEAAGWVAADLQGVKPTAKGLDFLNEVLMELLPEPGAAGVGAPAAP